MKEPIISCFGVKRSIRIAAGLVMTSVILVCVIFPKGVLADGSTADLQTTTPKIAAEIAVTPETEHQSNILQEELLISLLMKDVDVSTQSRIINDEKWQVVRMRVTGYCTCSQCCGDFSDGITANNHRIQPGDTFVAAHKSYQFGTEMMVPGYNGNQTVQVMDRGGAIKGNRLDLFFHTHQQALQWGVHYLDVLIKAK